MVSAAAPPRHVAVIMDGNGRWALQRGLSRREGHRRGLDAARKTLRACAAHKIPYLSLFAFSSEKWSRPEEEVSALMMLFADSAKSLVGELRDNGVRVRFIGQRERFSPMLRQAMESMEAATDGGGGYMSMSPSVIAAAGMSRRRRKKSPATAATSAKRISQNGCPPATCPKWIY